MSDLVETALGLWGLTEARHTFVAGRENEVYRVEAAQGDFALRIKRPGYRTEAELRSELLWLDAMAKAGLSVPRPRALPDGTCLAQIGGHFVDVIGWLNGTAMDAGLTDAPGGFRRLGAEMARLHTASDAWVPPPDFVRCQWNLNGLLGESAVWGRFWENPTLEQETRTLLDRFRARARADLKAIADTLDYGLIHADLLQENVLFDGAVVRILDFDDGGFGFRLFDVATTLLRTVDADMSGEIRDALIEGYRTIRPLDVRHLDLFMALRAMTYVGWIVPRMADTAAPERNKRFVTRARQFAADYLSTNP